MSLGCITVSPGILLKSSFSSNVQMLVMPLFFIMTLWMTSPQPEWYWRIPLLDVVEEFREVVILPRADINKVNSQLVQSTLVYELVFNC